jgi:hypothetical protein
VFPALYLLGMSLTGPQANTLPANMVGSCAQYPYLKPNQGPLALLNCDMHESYDARVKEIMGTFGSPNGRPVVINLGGTLILKHGSKTEQIDISPMEFQEIKSFCHASLAVFLILSNKSNATLDKHVIEKLKQMQVHLASAKAIIDTLGLTKEAADAANEMTNLTTQFVQTTLSHKTWNKSDLHHYYEQLQPSLKILIDSAANLQLTLLNQAINQWLTQLTPEEKQHIGIVVAAAHQARAGEISVDYFAKKFNKHLGIGAQGEDGLVIMEDKFDEESAYKLLAKHYLDREIGQAIFNDSESLQHDLLMRS